MRARAVLFGVVVAILPIAVAGARATTHRRPARKPVLLHLHWKLVADRQGNLLSDGRYLFWVENPYTGAGTVLNDETGVRIEISPPGQGCVNAVAAGGQWLMFSCSDGLELYSLPTAQWTTVDYSQRSREVCGGDDLCFMDPVAVGSRWIEFSISSRCSATSSCTSGFGFQNIQTGAWRRTPKLRSNTSRYTTLSGLNAKARLNLNATSLMSSVCWPLRLPHDGRLLITGEGLTPAVKFFGPYAVVGDPYVSGQLYLEKCGSRKRSRITWPSAGSSRLLLWHDNDKLDGLFLASHRRFVDQLNGLVPPEQGGFIVGPRHIYATDNSGHIWATPVPHLPR